MTVVVEALSTVVRETDAEASDDATEMVKVALRSLCRIVRAANPFYPDEPTSPSIKREWQRQQEREDRHAPFDGYLRAVETILSAWQHPVHAVRHVEQAVAQRRDATFDAVDCATRREPCHARCHHSA